MITKLTLGFLRTLLISRAPPPLRKVSTSAPFTYKNLNTVDIQLIPGAVISNSSASSVILNVRRA
jgi:hypothetical protein